MIGFLKDQNQSYIERPKFLMGKYWCWSSWRENSMQDSTFLKFENLVNFENNKEKMSETKVLFLEYDSISGISLWRVLVSDFIWYFIFDNIFFYYFVYQPNISYNVDHENNRLTLLGETFGQKIWRRLSELLSQNQ